MCFNAKTGLDTCAGPGKSGCQQHCSMDADGQLRLKGTHRSQVAPARPAAIATEVSPARFVQLFLPFVGEPQMA